MKRLVRLFISLMPVHTAYAHCDIPCGIYDPHTAQVAAHTVIRMTGMLNDLEASSDNAPFEERKKIIHQVARLTKVKEEHAELLKHEVRVIWGDYFKPEHLKDYPDLHEKVFSIMKLASKARQSIDMESAQKLLTAVQEFAEIFWKTKNRETVRVPSGYPTEGEIVLPK
jgi:nickel superoxide dismutase